MIQNIDKIKGLINIANKAGYLIIGSDALKGYNKKLYLVLYNLDIGKNSQKIVKQIKANINCVVYGIENCDYPKIVNIPNCKIVGIKNKGLSEEIIKYLRGDDIG